ncbi:unnamed protein product [Allacma fusca]|uniref:Uncharacterized protein n=1 Tax=Allacma fusca TaxID=39272 RepID=A0A8J2L3J5_9HEXA|nr:unnamed protein product [Allacma fusca]
MYNTVVGRNTRALHCLVSLFNGNIKNNKNKWFLCLLPVRCGGAEEAIAEKHGRVGILEEIECGSLHLNGLHDLKAAVPGLLSRRVPQRS